jgi:hypothetical protein
LSIVEDDEKVYVTVCNDLTVDWQLPILFVSLGMVLILGLSSGAVYLLHRTLHPIQLMEMSRSCFPALCFDSIWPEDQKRLKGPVLHFLINPCKQTFDETNARLVETSSHNLIYWAVKHGYLEILKKIFTSEITVELSLPILTSALMEGEARAIKFILTKAAKEDTSSYLPRANISLTLEILTEKRGMTSNLQIS